MKTANEKLAASKTLTDYEQARVEYRHRGGSLFAKWCRSDGAKTIGERLTEHLRKGAESLKLGVAKAELLSPDDCDDIVDALQLPLEIHYAEYKYVGSGGNCREDPRFDIEECWEKSEETEIRAALVEALYRFCQLAAAYARRLGAKSTQRLFMRALYQIETNCRSHAYSNVAGGCTETVAKTVCREIALAARQLWAEMEVDLGDKILERQIRLWKKHQEIVPSPKSAKTTVEKPETIRLGPWAAKIVKPLEPGSRTLVFKGIQEVSLTVPEKRKGAWECIKAVLTTTDPQGWAELPEAVAKWTGHFRVVGATDSQNRDIADPDDDLTRLRYHLENQNTTGKHGKPTLRLRKEFNCKEFQKVRMAYESARKTARSEQRLGNVANPVKEP